MNQSILIILLAFCGVASAWENTYPSSDQMLQAMNEADARQDLRRRGAIVAAIERRLRLPAGSVVEERTKEYTRYHVPGTDIQCGFYYFINCWSGSRNPLARISTEEIAQINKQFEAPSDRFFRRLGEWAEGGSTKRRRRSHR